MKIIKPDLNKYFVLPNRGLRVGDSRTVAGQSTDYRTPFWNARPREEILSEGDNIFDKGAKEADEDIFQSLFDGEREMRSKVGPLSIQKPLKERMEGIKEYWELSQYNGPIPKEAVDLVVEEFKSIRGIRLRSIKKVIDNMILSTNSGSPYFTKRKLVVNKSHTLLPDNKELCAVLGGRGQEGGPHPDDVKQRTVFMMPFSMNVQEHRFYQPFIEAVQRTALIPAYVSLASVEEKVTKLFDTKSPDDLVIATDFSKMDHHFNKCMQQIAREIITRLLTPSAESKNGIDEIYPLKYNIPLYCSDEIMILGDHGMGSGSSGTNGDESLAHRTLQHEAARRRQQILNKYSLYLGDDGILSYFGITVEDVVKTYTEFGMDMNPEKQYAAKDNTIFLRRWYHTKYRNQESTMVGVYSTYRALGRLMGQERYYDPKIWGPKAVTLRAGSILENCSSHPLFEKLVDFVIKGDKYKLGLLIPGFISEIESEYEKLKSVSSNGESYSRSFEAKGIKTGRIYKYLSSK